MKTMVVNIINTVFIIGMLYCGVAILFWSIDQIRLAGESREWPQAEGIVIRSRVEQRRREHRPDITYQYQINGRLYQSNQISFDIFDRPGGKGLVETIVNRYPVGRKVIVFYDASDPSRAILEPEDYSPFLVPLFWGSVFILGGMLILWRQLSIWIEGQKYSLVHPSYNQFLSVTTTGMTALFYVIINIAAFESAARERFILAFGIQPLGVPNIIFSLCIVNVVFLPLPWVIWHSINLVLAAGGMGQKLGIGFLWNLKTTHPEFLWSRTVCVAAFIYFVVMISMWAYLSSAPR